MFADGATCRLAAAAFSQLCGVPVTTSEHFVQNWKKSLRQRSVMPRRWSSLIWVGVWNYTPKLSILMVKISENNWNGWCTNYLFLDGFGGPYFFTNLCNGAASTWVKRAVKGRRAEFLLTVVDGCMRNLKLPLFLHWSAMLLLFSLAQRLSGRTPKESSKSMFHMVGMPGFPHNRVSMYLNYPNHKLLVPSGSFFIPNSFRVTRSHMIQPE